MSCTTNGGEEKRPLLPGKAMERALIAPSVRSESTTTVERARSFVTSGNEFSASTAAAGESIVAFQEEASRTRVVEIRAQLTSGSRA